MSDKGKQLLFKLTMKKKFFVKQLESAWWTQAAMKLWIASQFLTSGVSIYKDAQQYSINPSWQNELQLSLYLYGGWKDVEDAKMYSWGKATRKP